MFQVFHKRHHDLWIQIVPLDVFCEWQDLTRPHMSMTYFQKASRVAKLLIPWKWFRAFCDEPVPIPSETWSQLVHYSRSFTQNRSRPQGYLLAILGPVCERAQSFGKVPHRLLHTTKKLKSWTSIANGYVFHVFSVTGIRQNRGWEVKGALNANPLCGYNVVCTIKI